MVSEPVKSFFLTNRTDVKRKTNKYLADEFLCSGFGQKE
jgi:hypothetical protein